MTTPRQRDEARQQVARLIKSELIEPTREWLDSNYPNLFSYSDFDYFKKVYKNALRRAKNKDQYSQLWHGSVTFDLLLNGKHKATHKAQCRIHADGMLEVLRHVTPQEAFPSAHVEVVKCWKTATGEVL